MKTPSSPDILIFDGIAQPGPTRQPLAQRAGECLALLFLGDSPDELTRLADTLAGHTASSSAARVLVDGQDVTLRPPGARGITLVGPRDPLFDHLSIRENISLPLRARRTPQERRPQEGIRHRTDQILALLGLERRQNSLPPSLSPSERLRAALARALMAEPLLLVLEDVFSGLDTEARRDLHNRIHRLHRARGLSILLLTRDRTDALALGDRIGVVSSSALLQIGRAHELIDHPASAQVATAMTDTNVLIGMALSVEDDLAVVRLACGGEMEAIAAPDVRENDLVELCVRPNQIAPMFRRGPAAPDEAGGALPATLAEIRNLGDLLVLRFRLVDGTDMTVHRPPGSLPPGAAAGAAALLAWQASGALVFPSDTKEG